MDKETGLFENIKLLYDHYGGYKSLISSGYCWISVIITLFAWPLIASEQWIKDIAFPILPALAGFSIAAYAIYFAVLGEGARKALAKPSPELGGRSPLLVLLSSITHAVIIQVSTLLMAIIFLAKPLPTLKGYEQAADWINLAVSALGLFMTIYAIILVIGAVLSIFKISEIQTRI